jgi:tRNA(Ile)-lysidine synthase
MPDHVLLTRLRENLAQWSPLGPRLVVAVSGGPDSVALLRGLAACAGQETRLVVAHLNHGLRHDRAERDEGFVVELAKKMEVDVVTGRADVEAEAQRRRESLETAARHCRYEFLRNVADTKGAQFVALGHTADDQAETILHRVVRGTGLEGLRGMPVRRRLGPSCDLVRPLLNVRRRDVLDYLAATGQPYCLDETNDELRHTRNRLRNDLLPLLERQYNPRVREALLRLGQLAGEVQQVIDDRAHEVLDRAKLRRLPNGCSLRVAPLAGCHAHVRRAVFLRLWQEMGWGRREMGFEQLDRLAHLVGNPAGAITLPGNIDACRRGNRIELTRSRKPTRHAADAESLVSG